MNLRIRRLAVAEIDHEVDYYESRHCAARGSRREAGHIVTVILITFTLDIIILRGRIDLTERPRGAFPGPRLLAT
jgi:hypothetical protein